MNTNEIIARRASQIVRRSRAHVPRSRDSQLATRQAPARQGILLLVVLSMLTLFLLIGTAFIVSSDHYRQINKIQAKITEQSNSSVDQGDLLNEVINQLVRDTNNQNSTLRFHSLLRDMYGNDGFVGEAIYFADSSHAAFLTLVSKYAGAIPSTLLPEVLGVTDGQIVEVAVYDSANPADEERPRNLFGNFVNLSNLDRYYNGRVLTWTSGPSKGQSARVIGYRYDTSNAVRAAMGLSGLPPTAGIGIVRLMTFPRADGQTLTPTRGPPSTSRSPEIEELSDVGTGGNLGATFVINGQQFNGTGFGYNALAAANAARLNSTEAVFDSSGTVVDMLIALSPSTPFFDFNPVSNVDPTYYGFSGTGAIPLSQRLYSGLGGSDESYDAVDFQNMSLSLMPLNPVETVLTGNPGSWPDTSPIMPTGDWNPPPTLPLTLGNMIIPSFHRPALINYWKFAVANFHFEPNLLRKAIIRPSWYDHPNFSGSNPDLSSIVSGFGTALDGNDTPEIDRYSNQLLQRMIYGPWDVDNDNDGVRDSVWVDFGAPVMENSDGKLVKPLAAILVVDMDGRLNLNAHGSEDVALNSISGQGLMGLGMPAPPVQTLAGGVLSSVLAQGEGYGPAEISLAPLMPGVNPRQRWDWHRRYFRGAALGDSFVEAVTDLNPANNPRRFRHRRIGKLGGTDVVPGKPSFDIQAQLKMQGVPRWASGQVAANATGTLVLGGYATPPDLRGRYALGLNDLGQPFYEALDPTDANNDNIFYDNTVRLNEDTPYEIDLSLGAARGENAAAADGPYTMAELERVLRAYDADAGVLPSRIWEMAGEFMQSSSDTTPNLDRLNLWRQTVTTDSFDLPVPCVVLPEWMYVGPDGKPGVAGQDDDSNGTVDDSSEIGWSEDSDDYQSVMDPSPLPVTPRRRTFAPVALSFADLLEYRIRAAQSPVWPKFEDAANPLRVTQIRQEMAKLLPPDLADGLRLDINRPLGNGRDDNDNGVVDEPGEWDDVVNGNGNGRFDVGDEFEAPYWSSGEPSLAAFTDGDDDSDPGDNYNFTGHYRDVVDRNGDGAITTDYERGEGDVDGNGTTDANDLIFVHNLRRQSLARDLYVLAMTLIDPLPATAILRDREARSRHLAQWAINVVDFRDPDNIMTAFEYDTNPFDGWDPDGNLASQDDIYGNDSKPGGAAGTLSADQGGVVWGAERPELLITETLAWHDRRTENHADEKEANDEDNDGEINQDDRGMVPTSSAGIIPDSDFDQRYLPQGAGFIELYCPWPENPATNADTYGVDAAGDYGVDIAALDAATNSSPVWRIMNYKTGLFVSGQEKGGGPQKDPDSPFPNEAPQIPDRCVYFAGFDPGYSDDGAAFFNDYNEIDGTGNPDTRVPVVRPGKYMVVGAGKKNGTRYEASFGAITGNTSDSDRAIVLDTNPATTYSVALNRSGTGTSIYRDRDDPSGFRVAASPNLASVAIIDQAMRKQDSNPISPIVQKTARFSFSEPAMGYPRRVFGSTMQSTPQGDTYSPILDIPIDDQRSTLVAPGGIGGGGGGGTGIGQRPPGNTSYKDNETRLMLPLTGGGAGTSVGESGRTVPGFSWVYLQRLANPLLPWNPASGASHNPNRAVNPYLTVDSSGVNVTVFNGIEREELHRKLQAGGGNPIATFSNTNSKRTFSSLQRGRWNDPLKMGTNLPDFQQKARDPVDHKIIVSRLNPDSPPAGGLIENVWNHETIGAGAGLWRNNNPPDSTHNMTGIPDCTLGFLNEPFRRAAPDTSTRNTARDQEKIEPENPFPWLTWNNRPYANAGELLLVPGFRSSQILQAFSFDTKNVKHQYSEKVTERPTSMADPLKVDGVYGHLMNFFRTDNKDASGMPLSAKNSGIAGLQRMLDYIHVPTPYVGSETWLNPAAFGEDDRTTSADDVVSTNDPRYLRQPPFNRISEYREPGRVNINSVLSPDVWEGGVLHRELIDPSKAVGELLDFDFSNVLDVDSSALFPPTITFSTVFPPYGINVYVASWPRNHFQSVGPGNPRIYGHAGPKALELTDSRRGYGPANSSGLLLEPNSPTFFANPFRSADNRELVPLNAMLRAGVDCTITRSETGTAGATAKAAGQPLFATKPDDDSSTTNVVEDYAFRDVGRNPYFRYQPITRLSSMTTNRSNVYAVWVTIGFFEVEKAPDKNTFRNRNDPTNAMSPAQLQALYDRVYPEGYQFGPEAGSEIGNIQRVREFAMIDRTVPVAFEPGQNHNVDKAIRLRRRIE